MIEQHIDIPTADGAMNAFVVHPDIRLKADAMRRPSPDGIESSGKTTLTQEDGPFPVVLFYMDAPGKREELHDMARRIAAVGYCVILPNLYYRRTRDFWLQERTEPAMAHMFTLMDTLNAATTECDSRALLRYLNTQPQLDPTRVGAVGYCMSGPFVMWAAAAFPERLRCIASIHGANMATEQPDSPHRIAHKIRCESYFACAETDKWAPPADIQKLQASLEVAGAKHRIEWYPGVEHGFVFPLRTGIYNRAAAERHWERLFSLLRRSLRS